MSSAILTINYRSQPSHVLISVCTLVVLATCSKSSGDDVPQPALSETAPAFTSTAMFTPGSANRPAVSDATAQTPAEHLSLHTPTPHATKPIGAEGALLLSVSEVSMDGNAFRPRQEIWVLDSGNTTPRRLLASNQSSFEFPMWSPDGQWIAYQQRELSAELYFIGLIRANGSEMQTIAGPLATSPRRLAWSADKQWLTYSSWGEAGATGAALNLHTHESRELNPTAAGPYQDASAIPSPNDGRVLLIGKTVSSPNLEIWLTTLDSSVTATLLRMENWPGCNGFTSAGWSTDGNRVYIQPNQDTPQPNQCPPAIWTYDINTQTWTRVAAITRQDPHLWYLNWIEWSPDGKWVLWKSSQDALIFDSTSWTVSRTISLNSDEILLTRSWATNESNGSAIAVAKFDFGQPPDHYELQLLSPQNASANNLKMAGVIRSGEWLPTGMDYLPWAWQPR